MKTNQLCQFTFACLLVVVGALFATGARADPPARVGRLSYLSGPVSFAPAGLDNEWSLAVMNRPVTTGDHLWSDADGRAEVHIGSTAIRLGASTNLDVLNLDGRTTQLRMVQGTVNVRVRHIARADLFEIDTPSTAVLIQRAGSYRIDVDPNGQQTLVSVRYGEVNVSGPNANFLLHDDQQATLYRDSANYQLTRLPPLDNFDQFWLARDQVQDRVRSVRYVPDAMTGYEDLDSNGSWANLPAYGTVWFPARVAADWAPYRDGRWMWVEPWGWTWVDNAPWGFAPFHYGRWAYVQNRWGWCPGDVRAPAVYAPALVAFVGGSGFSASISLDSGPVVGWFPLGYREAYVPWYSVSPTYMRQVNVANVTNVRNLTNITQVTNVTNINYANRNVPSAMTVVPGAVFTQSRMVAPSMLKTSARQALAHAPVIHGGAPIAPARQSLIAGPATARPPAAATSRPVVAIHAPPPRPPSFTLRQAEVAKQADKPFQVRPLATAVTPGKAAPPAGAQAPVRMIQPPHAGHPGLAVQSNAGRPAEGPVAPQMGKIAPHLAPGVPPRPSEALVAKGQTFVPHPPARAEEQGRAGSLRAPGAPAHPPEPRAAQAGERAHPPVTPGQSPAAPQVSRSPRAEERVHPSAAAARPNEALVPRPRGEMRPPQPQHPVSPRAPERQEGRPIEAPRPPQAEERVRPVAPIIPPARQSMAPPRPERNDIRPPQPQHPVPPPRLEQRAPSASPPPQAPPSVRQGPPAPAVAPHEPKPADRRAPPAEKGQEKPPENR